MRCLCWQIADSVPPSNRADIRKPYPVRQAFATHSALAWQIADSAAITCPHRAAQAAVAAGIHKPQSMRQCAAPDHGQRDESVTPSSRTAAVDADIRKPQSMRQAPRQITDSVTKACPHRVAHRQWSMQAFTSRSQYGQARAMHSAFARQIVDSAAKACPHRAAQTAVAAGVHKPQPMRQAPRQIADSVTRACPHRAAQAFVSPLPSPAKSSH